MAEASRRAARPARKGGLPNAAFLLASAEAPPAPLCAIAELVTVRFPWGSLLRGCVGADAAVAAGLAALVGARGTLELLLAPAARDHLDGIPIETAALAAAAAEAFAPFGLRVVVARPATDAEVAASGSTWARRLGAGRGSGAAERAPTLIRLVRR